MATNTISAEEYRALLATSMTHKDLQAKVRRVATVNGWRTFCWWSSLHSPAGWPDLVLVREVNERQARMIFAELKREKEEPSPEQLEVHRLLRLTGHAVHVWHPSDLLSGLIEEALAVYA